MVSGQRHETTQRRSATAIHIPVALCDAPGVKTKILSTKKGPGCKHRSRSHGESGEVFLLDTLSHRMSVMAILRQLTNLTVPCSGNSSLVRFGSMTISQLEKAHLP